jgi:hypothetical protein
MPPQVTRDDFECALREMGHNPDDYRGKQLTLESLCEIYGLDENIVIEAIKLRHIDAHYDYRKDSIWVDALDAAHFYYCIRSESQFYAA